MRAIEHGVLVVAIAGQVERAADVLGVGEHVHHDGPDVRPRDQRLERRRGVGPLVEQRDRRAVGVAADLVGDLLVGRRARSAVRPSPSSMLPRRWDTVPRTVQPGHAGTATSHASSGCSASSADSFSRATR